MILMMVSGWLSRGPERAGHSRAVVAGAVALAGVSLALPYLHVDAGMWFISLWWMFCLGMVVCWRHVGTLSAWTTAALVAAVGASCLVHQLRGEADPWGGEWTAWGTCVLVVGYSSR